MNGDEQYRRLLRWYPGPWRDRYGDELVEMMHDEYGGRRISGSARRSIALAGASQRVRMSGLVGDRDDPADRVRAGALLVLCSWALFVVAGSAFAKFAEHWAAVTPPASRAVPAAAYVSVSAAAALGAVIVGMAAAAAAPSFRRSMRQGGWSAIRRSVARAASVSLAALVAGVGVITWAHHLSGPQRNGGLLLYGVVVLGWGLLVVAALTLWTWAAVVAMRRTPLTLRVLRIEGWLAFGATAAMVVVAAGTIAWWAAMASSAPWFLDGGAVGSTASAVPPAMVIAGTLMVGGVLAAGAGAVGIARSMPELGAG
jgi:hypothetical protein